VRYLDRQIGIEVTTLLPGCAHWYMEEYTGIWVDTMVTRLMSMYLNGCMQNKVNALACEWIH
jgi:hypothetical protein